MIPKDFLGKLAHALMMMQSNRFHLFYLVRGSISRDSIPCILSWHLISNKQPKTELVYSRTAPIDAISRSKTRENSNPTHHGWPCSLCCATEKPNMQSPSWQLFLGASWITLLFTSTLKLFTDSKHSSKNSSRAVVHVTTSWAIIIVFILFVFCLQKLFKIDLSSASFMAVFWKEKRDWLSSCRTARIDAISRSKIWMGMVNHVEKRAKIQICCCKQSN